VNTKALVNTQTAPYPQELATMVRSLQYKAHWRFELCTVDRGQDSAGLTLDITITTPDSYHPQSLRTVCHWFPVPPAAYDMRSWRRWLFEQIHSVELHEAMEFFQIDGSKPYAPSHGPGNDPYLLREVGTDVDQRTSFRGDLNQ
jgi:hypothetical protein